MTPHLMKPPLEIHHPRDIFINHALSSCVIFLIAHQTAYRRFLFCECGSCAWWRSLDPRKSLNRIPTKGTAVGSHGCMSTMGCEMRQP
jgi:hypothetical protein